MTEHPSTTPAPDPLVGTVLEDRYEILECIGHGGMSTVYRARQLRMERDVAIKLLRQDRPLTRRSVGRFQREARVASLLKHPNTIVTYDFGESTKGLYIVMELLQGETLSDRLKAVGPLSDDAVARVGAGIAASLAEAHERGIVHRDLKPANVFLHRVRGMEVVKVLDFGIAKFIADSEDLDIGDGKPPVNPAMLYQTSVVQGQHTLIGTCYYMAPEVVLGDKFDGRSDIYTLGCILYEMLTGIPPFEGPTFDDVVRKHLEAPLPPLPESIDEDLRVLVTVMLAKTPDRRPRSADEVVAALKRIVGESGVNGVIALTGREDIYPDASPPTSASGLEVDFDHGRDPDTAPRRDLTAPRVVKAPKLPKVDPALRAPSDRERSVVARRPPPSPWIRRLGAVPPWGWAAGLGALVVLVAFLLTRESASDGPAPKNYGDGQTAPTAKGIGLNTARDHWRLIEASSFRMGSNDQVAGAHPSEMPDHTVRVSRSFQIFRSEVTRSQWRQVLGVVPVTGQSCGETCPVEGVSWYDAVSFVNALSSLENRSPCYTLADCTGTPGDGLGCRTVSFAGLACTGYRLPTEAEWEFAARAVDTSAMSLQEREGNPPPHTSAGPVRRAPASAWGLYDVLGGVGEWTHDRFSADYYRQSPSTDPTGPSVGDERTWRDCTYADPAIQCRFAVRRFGTASTRPKRVGLRPVITAQ